MKTQCRPSKILHQSYRRQCHGNRKVKFRIFRKILFLLEVPSLLTNLSMLKRYKKEQLKEKTPTTHSQFNVFEACVTSSLNWQGHSHSLKAKCECLLCTFVLFLPLIIFKFFFDLCIFLTKDASNSSSNSFGIAW